MRNALLIIALAGLACGGQETSTSPDMGAAEAETPAVSAVPAPAAQAPAAQPAAVQPPSDVTTPDEAAEAVDAVEVTTCVKLVQGGKYAEAVVACQTAVSLYPDNAAAAAALAKAGAASAAAGATADAAKSVKLP